MPDPTPTDRLALAVCRAAGYPGPCHVSEICNGCREKASAVIRELAEQVVPATSPRDRATWSPVTRQIRAEILTKAAELESPHG